jgi:tetratricopeptide (TPR) repeat protein
MYRNPETFRLPTLRRPARRGLVPQEALRLALSRVEKAHQGYRADLHFDPIRLRNRLNMVVPGAPQETMRVWSLGWLAWLTGEYDKAELILEQATQMAKAAGDLEMLARAGYWLARVQMLREKPDAISSFEALLRVLKGSPQGTVWFVDLLIRAGRMDRAEQVWKSVKANKKVSGANEATLIEARLMLRRGESANAEKALQEMPETSGVLEAEKKLLLAWMAASKKQDATALQLWEEACKRLYPPPALDAWRELLQLREKADATLPETPPPSLRTLFRAQQARIDGRSEEAIAGFREAMQLAVNAPWARYGLALLGADDLNEVQTLATNVFLASRCRLWIALQKFSQRQISPEDWLSTVQQQLGQGVRSNAALEHFRLLGLALRQSRPPVETLQQLLDQATARQGAQRRNFLRAFLELCDKAAPQVVKEVLPEEPLGELWDDPRLRQELSRLRLRAALAGGGEPWTMARLTERVNSLPATEALTPVRQILGTLGTGPLTDEQRATLTALEALPRWQGTARVLLMHDAMRRGDVAAVSKSLEQLDTWAGLRFIPGSLVAALAKFVQARPTLPVWKAVLPPWFQKVGGSLGDTEDVKTLKMAAGLLTAPTGPQPAPPGVDPTLWSLHQAARLSARGEAVDAWKAASEVRDKLGTLTEEQQTTVNAALPSLERLAQASAILRMIPTNPKDPATPPAALLDLVALLGSLPEGQAVLAICQADQRKELRAALQTLLDVKVLPDRLAHHLAIWTYRIATGLEDLSPNDTIDPWWKLCWRAWLRHLIKWSPEERAPLIDHLLARHRATLTDRLARAQMEPSRKVWTVVTDLPSIGEKVSPAMKAELTERVNAFRDDLASEYLVQTREAMRTGTVREGFSADYDKGLSYLRRLLSLDRENIRLLTALVEICHEWFLDFYNAEDPPGLSEQLERFTPFALQLARLIEGKPEEHAPRAALSDFWKFRGFMSRDHAEKRRLFEQALEFNPANENARDLLARLDKPQEPTPASTESSGIDVSEDDDDLDDDDLDDDDDIDSMTDDDDDDEDADLDEEDEK